MLDKEYVLRLQESLIEKQREIKEKFEDHHYEDAKRLCARLHLWLETIAEIADHVRALQE